MIYENKHRSFQLWAYMVSHNTLIIRSSIRFPDTDGYSDLNDHTIDLEFSGVNYIELPTHFDGLEISFATNDQVQRLTGWMDDRSTAFEICTQGKSYNLVADQFIIGKSDWTFEDRIKDFNLVYPIVLFEFSGR